VTLEYVAGKELPGYPQGRVLAMSGVTPVTQLARFVLVLDTSLLEEMRTEFPGIEELLESGVKSIMATPLVHRDEVVEFLATATSVEDAYTPEHVGAAERISAQISGALANSRLHARISRIAQIREILVQIGREASVASNLQDLYAGVINSLKDLFPVDRSAIAVRTENGNSLLNEHVSGIEIEGLEEGQILSLDDMPDGILSKAQLISAYDVDDERIEDPSGGIWAKAGLMSNIRRHFGRVTPLSDS
jgi:GAF domain-containing protein